MIVTTRQLKKYWISEALLHGLPDKITNNSVVTDIIRMKHKTHKL